MDLEDIMLSEINQTEKEKYYTTSLTYGTQKNKLVNKTLNKYHRYREQTSGYWLGEGTMEGQDKSRELRGTNYYV